MKNIPIEYVELESVYARSIGHGYQVVAITAAEDGVGVSTLVTALAKRSQAGGHRTLIIDLNLQHPNIGQNFDLSPHFCDLYENENERLIHKVEKDNLSVLLAPIDDKNLLKLREHDYFSRQLNRWRADYDVIIIDTSPVNAINRNNIPSELICSACDAAIMVVSAGKSQESGVKHAYSKLKNAHVNVVGTVINDKENPSLANELIRETYRLEKWMPNLMSACRRYIKHSEFLNLE